VGQFSVGVNTVGFMTSEKMQALILKHAETDFQEALTDLKAIAKDWELVQQCTLSTKRECDESK
jgi:hypothetical protein